MARPILEIGFFEKKSKISFLIIGKEGVSDRVSYQQQMCALKRNKDEVYPLKLRIETKVIYKKRQIYF